MRGMPTYYVTEVRVRFKGQLLLPSERGPGLHVALEVADHHLAVVSEQEELGAWPLEAVTARRVRGDTFAITVAGEDLHFVADDTISFAYSGMPAIQKFARPSRTRSLLRSLLDLVGLDTSKPGHAPEVTPPPAPAAIDESPPSRETESSPHGQLPNEAEPQLHGLDTPQQVPDPEPELRPPSTSGRTGSPSDANTIEQLHQDGPLEHEPTASPIETIRCPALRNDGLPCRSPVIGPSGYCYPHDPERALGQGFRKAQEARARLIRKGTARLTRVYARLDKAFRQVERGDLEPEKAMAMAQLARTMCAILELDEESPVDTHEDSSPPTPNQPATQGDNDTHSGPRLSEP